MKTLDRPVWHALDTLQRPLSTGEARARRYLPAVNVFASARDDSDEALQALADLVDPEEALYILQVPPIAVPGTLQVRHAAEGVQMVAGHDLSDQVDQSEVVTLTRDDVPDMVALARLTEPGPFLDNTLAMGHFRGVCIDGRLAAMAGERMRFPGATEVSGVCTHPDFRGRGLARKLSAVVASGIQERGDLPFLHAWATNTAAIGLYASLGFEHRSMVQVAVLVRS